MQDAVADATLVDYLERSGADLVEVLARLRWSEQREVTSYVARSLERVVHCGEVLAQQRALSVTMRQPQVLKRGDMAEIPDQRAHQGGVDAFEVVV